MDRYSYTRHIISLVLSTQFFFFFFLLILWVFFLSSQIRISLNCTTQSIIFLGDFASRPSTVLHCLIHFLLPYISSCCPGNPTQSCPIPTYTVGMEIYSYFLRLFFYLNLISFMWEPFFFFLVPALKWVAVAYLFISMSTPF